MINNLVNYVDICELYEDYITYKRLQSESVDDFYKNYYRDKILDVLETVYQIHGMDMVEKFENHPNI